MERPYVLGVDLDGVCGDYTDAFRTVVAEELGCGLEELPLEKEKKFRLLSRAMPRRALREFQDMFLAIFFFSGCR